MGLSGQKTARRMRGRRPTHVTGQMNGLEAAWSRELEASKLAGKVLLWRFEAVKLRLAQKTWYTPDFWVLKADGSVEIHETKGYVTDDGRVKLKVAAELYPELAFFQVKRERGAGWSIEAMPVPVEEVTP